MGWIYASYNTEPQEHFQSEGEDYSNPETCRRFAMHHPDVNIKYRKLNALIALYDPKAKKFDYHGHDDYEAAREKHYSQPVKEHIAPILKRVMIEISKLKHHTQDKNKFDPYWLMKETAFKPPQDMVGMMY